MKETPKSWYIDNREYLKKEFVDDIITSISKAKEEYGNEISTEIMKRYYADEGNVGSRMTAARDFGIIDSKFTFSPVTELYRNGIIPYNILVFFLISKRNSRKDEASFVKPIVLISKAFQLMREMKIDKKERFLSIAECYEYLCRVENYEECDMSLVGRIVDERTYTDEKRNVPQKRIERIPNEVCFRMIFRCLVDSNIFLYGEEKSLIRPKNESLPLIEFIAYTGEHMVDAPTQNRDALYEYMCDIHKGVFEIIPDVYIKNTIKKKKQDTRGLFEYIFGINRRRTFHWDNYFESDCFGVYANCFAIKELVITKMYLKDATIGEWLYDYSMQSKYSVIEKDGKFMIIPFKENAHTDIEDLINMEALKKENKRNRIFFGAPGTGKSFTLNKEKDTLLEDGGDYERVTFHPDYSYAHFVGTYKPVKNPNKEDLITYEYVPGPFIRLYVKAVKSIREGRPKPMLLIIEEINRANVASVFGDVFQLLDRKTTNVSEYPIHTSEDIKQYLSREDVLGGTPEDYAQLSMPYNLFVWATMNSADQGVNPMDTAFKRRWDFTYIDIDHKEEEIAGKTVILGKGEFARVVEWNSLRKAINEKLLKFKVNEDKLIGPHFLTNNIFDAEGNIIKDEFMDVFKNKVIMYLFEDAAKLKRNSLFEGCNETNRSLFSKVCRAFDDKGVYIFSDDISKNFIIKPEEE